MINKHLLINNNVTNDAFITQEFIDSVDFSSFKP